MILSDRIVERVAVRVAERAARRLDEATLRELWALRLRNIDLRPDGDARSAVRGGLYALGIGRGE